MKRNVIILLLTFVLVPVHSAMARKCYVEVNYSFNNNSVPGKKVRGFKLFKNGKKVCQIWKSTKRTFTCNFESAPGKYKITLAPFYTDSSVGQQSAPYTINIPKTQARSWVSTTNLSGSSTTSRTTGSTSNTSTNTYRPSPSKVRTMTSVMSVLDSLLLDEDRRKQRLQ